MLPYDSHWPPGQISYPPLPPPTPDETSFLNELASIGEQWPVIMQERSLRVQEIENRISSNRLANALPQFESFGLSSSSNEAPHNSYDPLNYPPPQQQLPPPLPLDYQRPPPPQNQFQADSQFPSLPLQPNYDLPPPQPLNSMNYISNGRGIDGKQERWENRNVVSTEQGIRETARVERVGERRGLAPTTTTHAPQWWERPLEPATNELSFEDLAQRYQSGYPQVSHNGLPAQQPFLSTPNYPLPSAQQPGLPLHPQVSQNLADRYRLPPPASQLPYQPPSREWNQALPPSFTGWDQPQALEQQQFPPQSQLQESFSSTSTTPLLAAGMSYATSATSQSTDRSRQSSSNLVDFAAANSQMISTAPTSGAGKRSRIDSANYVRPPLQPFLDHSSSSSQPVASSSSSLPTISSTSFPSFPTSLPSSNLPSAAVSQKSAPTATTTTTRRGTKTKVDIPISCVSCGLRLARLILRGQKHELDVPYDTVFHCLNCSPPLDGEGGSDQSPLTSVQEASSSESPPDLRQSAPQSRARRLSSTSTPPIPTTFRKKNKRLDEGATLTACDVCLMDRATGSVLPREPEKGHSINFQIEVVCVSCDEKYRRCSDCGGGGGIRLGTGKWRSKELFKEGKKTCSLRHQRLGAFPEMEYQVWKNTDLPRDELEEISQKCGEMFTNQMLGAIAIPEVLERNGAIWTSFAEAQSHAHSGWMGMDPMIRYNIEPTQGIRRYLALRLCAPNLRKTSRKGEPPAPVGPPRTGQVFKGDKEIVGYIIAEWAMHRGVLFLALVIPWDATGEAYDATTLLLQALCTRVQRDQQEENRLRHARGEPLLPKLERVFTMIFFKTGSRMITQLTKKRGFAPLEEYLAANPEADPLDFPPYRPIYLPIQRQMGWLILVRTLREHADGRADDWSARRSADEERGKKKELRAKAARDKKVKDADQYE